MIDSRELRIGNLILGVSDRIEKVVGISQQFAIMTVGKMPVAHRQQYQDISGIQLTEDWLLKLGLKKEHDRFYTFPNCGCIFMDGISEVCMGIIGEMENKTLTYVSTVHELQNLIFFLTGQELQLTT